MTDEERVSVSDAARQLGVSRKTLYEYIKKGMVERCKTEQGKVYIEAREVRRLAGELGSREEGRTGGLKGPDLVTIPREHYEGLLIRLGQLEATRTALLEYRQEAAERASRPWWKKLLGLPR